MQGRKKLRGSKRTPLGSVIGPANPDERFQVSVLLQNPSSDALKMHVDGLAALSAAQRPHLKREECADKFGADPTHIEAVKAFALDHRLAIVEEHAARCTVALSGTVAQFNKAFGVVLVLFQHDYGSHRGHEGPVMLPDGLDRFVQAVVGLDNRPHALPHFRTRPRQGNAQMIASSAAPASFTPTELANLYRFPAGTGQGECIAILEFGGGYRPADLKEYFAKLSIAAPPEVSAVSVDHGQNQPTGDVSGPDGEVMLDIEIAGAIAPGARIVVYFAPNSEAGFVDAVTTAIHDTTNKPSVISISWGGPELVWSKQAMRALDQAFQAAAAMGVTVCAASGDNGSSDGAPDGADHVDFPASSPYVLACGGTSVQVDNGTIKETVWNDGASGGATGGGVSNVFDRPSWQEQIDVTKKGRRSALLKRGVPDVSGDADPATGYEVRVDGYDTVIGGTSAVAPLWAGLIARMNSSRPSPLGYSPAGYINPWLYNNARDRMAPIKLTRDITEGNNGDFSASTGWDACTGLGRPAFDAPS